VIAAREEGNKKKEGEKTFIIVNQMRAKGKTLARQKESPDCSERPAGHFYKE